MEIKKIVVGTDFSAEAEIALKQGLNIARRTGAELVLVHAGTVQEPLEVREGTTGATMEAYDKLLRGYMDENRKQLAELRRRTQGQGAEVSHVMIDGFPDTAVVEAAHELNADMTIVGTHGRTGLKRLLLGSVAERIVRLSDNDVMVARDCDGNGAGGFKKILVPTDFSPSAERAFEAALLLARDGAEVHLLHCWQLPTPLGSSYVPGKAAAAVFESVRASIEEGARAKAEQLIARHNAREDATIEFDVVQASPSEGILERAPGYDLIVTGSHGRRGIRRFILGSVAEMAVRHAPCSVLVIHSKQQD